MQRLLAYPAAKPDFLVDGILHLAPFGIDATILPTPGHTEGSVSVVSGGFALAGDAIFGVVPGSVFPPFGQDIPPDGRKLAHPRRQPAARPSSPATASSAAAILLARQYRKFTERSRE